MNHKTLNFPTILFLIFLILKLTNYINWSWWWIISPILISFGLEILIISIVYIKSKCKH